MRRSSIWFVRKFGKINENEVVDVVIKLKDFNLIFKDLVWFMRNFVVANLMGKSSNTLFIYLGHIRLMGGLLIKWVGRIMDN